MDRLRPRRPHGPSALELVPAGEPDLSTLYGSWPRRKQLCGVQVSERFYEIGTPAALAETEAFLRELAALESR